MTEFILKLMRETKKIFRLLYAYLIADRIIGGYIGVKAKDNRVNLFEYRPDIQNYSRYNDSKYNLGDFLGFVIASWMLEKRGLSLETWIKKRKHLKCVGSNLYGGFQNATVWGSGIVGKRPGFYWRLNEFLKTYPLTRLDIRAVRGPLTRDVLLKWGQKCPDVYGDPAILMPFIYQPTVKVNHDICVIPQFVTEKNFREKHLGLFIVSMNTNDYKYVIDAIVSSKKVITSSLHGIILAESYGVPAVFFRGLGKEIDFKYLDYYYSTNRFDIKIADTFEDALSMKPLPLPDLKPLQEGLLRTFPYDLWEDR